jgi:hypothetical protein
MGRPHLERLVVICTALLIACSPCAASPEQREHGISAQPASLPFAGDDARLIDASALKHLIEPDQQRLAPLFEHR